jgi:uncharacterized membrane protein
VTARSLGNEARPPDRRPLGRALTRRRRLTLGLLQLTYILVGFAFGLLLPKVVIGSVSADEVSTMLFAIAAGILTFMGVIYSLLFLVVQWGSTMFTPRLNVFRDHPIVWHAFGYFTGVFVFAITAAFAVGRGGSTSGVVPVTTVLMVLVAIGLFRILLTTAFNSIQLGSTLASLAERGGRVIDGVYPQSFDMERAAPTIRPAEGPPVRAEVRWPRSGGVLQRIEVERLLHLAAQSDSTVEFRLGVGESLRRDQVLAVVRSTGPGLGEDGVISCVVVGVERTFDQDPALTLRVLVDIALRALSSAVNDPTTASEVLDVIDALMARLASRDLGVERIAGVHGNERIEMKLPDWDDYVGLAFDELLLASAASLQVARKLVEVLRSLIREVPSMRRPPLQSRLDRETRALKANFPGFAD